VFREVFTAGTFMDYLNVVTTVIAEIGSFGC
jgi:hypothetical protein